MSGSATAAGMAALGLYTSWRYELEVKMGGVDCEEGERVEAARRKLEEKRRQLLEERKRAIGFAASAVHRGENQAAFDQLLERLRTEYQPEGVEDALQAMAQVIWRKQHLDRAAITGSMTGS